MKKVVKFVGMILGALVLGGFMGWVFGMLGLETPVAVAISFVIVTACNSMYKKKKIA